MASLNKPNKELSHQRFTNVSLSMSLNPSDEPTKSLSAKWKNLGDKRLGCHKTCIKELHGCH